MKGYIGIDLGTTNSVICSYDGSTTRIWKSPEQNDVTPSAIFFDKRGNKYLGNRAYDSAPYNPDSSAILFKRLMGTKTRLHFANANITMSPEECSAEVLKILFGYLPDELRNNPESGSVITVPAAFNQMQKDSTMHAAQIAGIGNVVIMQEPVAAVMSTMRFRKNDGIFVIYDLGGGTLDIAIAESIGGSVNLLSHGGIAICGGRDFDRVLVDNIVKPWIIDNFKMPDDLTINPKYLSLLRLATWATEKAKIELSIKPSTRISLNESETRVCDLSGREIFLDIPIDQHAYDKLINERVSESIEAVLQTLKGVSLSQHDIDSIVFIGGPTNYKPLRDKVTCELGIRGITDVNPMTAVAEGASLYAESIEWNTDTHSKKNNRGQIIAESNLNIAFNYITRTADNKAKIAVQVSGKLSDEAEFQIDSLDSGWSSGRIPLTFGLTLDIALSKVGDNAFKIFVFDSKGSPVKLENDKIVITKTAASIEAIPSSHSIGIEVLEKIGGSPVLDWLIRAGDNLPKKDVKVFKAAESLKSGGSNSINFKLWEGEIEDPITDNRPIGVLKITGSDFDDGVIPAGADLECEYEIMDSGIVKVEVSVPCIGSVFHSGRNFYSSQEGQLDYMNVSELVIDEGETTLNRIDEISEAIENPKLLQARQKLENALSLDPGETDTDKSQEAMEKVLEAKKLLAQVRKEHLKEIRQLELDKIIAFFEDNIKQYARPSEITSFSSLIKTATRAIERNDSDFENHISVLKGKNFEILWRQDWFVIERFKWIANSSGIVIDRNQFAELVKHGSKLLQSDEIDELRNVVIQLSRLQISSGYEEDTFDIANIIKG
ncbi:MAG: Hsp70 family protein [Candidatus Cloacimonadaceae bacterium]|nr:Hsp70 family protein [Candidatus Cloacimonadaceae bacterium]